MGGAKGKRLLLSLTLSAAAGIFWLYLVPTQEVGREVDARGSYLSVRQWSGLLQSGNFDFWIYTPHGSVESGPVLLDVLPQPRFNVYTTPHGEIVVLISGGEARLVSVPFNEKPTLLTEKLLLESDSTAWSYVGAFGEDRRGRLRFYSPAELPECIPLLGEDARPYRMEQQEPHFCETKYG